MSYPVDVIIYLEKLNEEIFSVELKESLTEDGIEDFDKFNELLLEEITSYALDNFNQYNDPTLDMTQIERCFTNAILQYHIDSLRDKGLITSTIDEENGDLVYLLTDKGKDSVTNELFL